MSNIDSLGRSSSPSGQADSQTNLAGKGDNETTGQSLFDGLFALMNQPDPEAGPAALSVAQGLPAKAIFMSLSPVDQDNATDTEVIIADDTGQIPFLGADSEGSDKLTRLLLAAAEIVPDAGLPPVSDVMAPDSNFGTVSSESVLLVRAAKGKPEVDTAMIIGAAAVDPAAVLDSAITASLTEADIDNQFVGPMPLTDIDQDPQDDSTNAHQMLARPHTGHPEHKLQPEHTVQLEHTVQPAYTGRVEYKVQPEHTVHTELPGIGGPMPLTDSNQTLFGGTAGDHQVLARPHQDFVGPMPKPLHHHQPASTPLPLAISVEDGWQIMEPPSRSFIGPMPAVPKPDFLAGDGGMSPDAEMLPEKSSVALKPQDPSVQMMSRSATTAFKTPADIANPIPAAMTGSKVAADVALQSVQSVQAAAMSGEQTRTARAYNDAVQASSAGNTSGAEGPAAASSGSGQSSSGGGNGGGAQHQAAQAVDGFGTRDASGRMVVHRLNTERHGWAGTMVRQLDAGLKNGTQSIRIILQPGNLGRLNVDLGLRNGAAHIRVGAESAEAAQLLKGARHHLSQMLEQSGMRLAGLQTVNIGGEGASEGGLGQGGHGQHQAAGENGGRRQAFSNKMQQPDGVDATQTGDADAQDLLPRAGENAVLSILA